MQHLCMTDCIIHDWTNLANTDLPFTLSFQADIICLLIYNYTMYNFVLDYSNIQQYSKALDSKIITWLF